MSKKDTSEFFDSEGRDLTEERAWLDAHFPQTRGECESASRPCLFFRCRYNLVLTVKADGRIRMHFDPTSQKEQGRPTCALDVAAEGGKSRKALAKILGCSRPDIDQIMERAFIKLKIRHPELRETLEQYSDYGVRKRH